MEKDKQTQRLKYEIFLKINNIKLANVLIIKNISAMFLAKDVKFSIPFEASLNDPIKYFDCPISLEFLTN